MLRLAGALERYDAKGTVRTCVPLDERWSLVRDAQQEYTLSADAFVSVALGGISRATVLVVQVDSPCTLRLTSGAGSQQLVPVSDFAILTAKAAVGFTAIDIQRTPGISTVATIYLGETS